MIGKVYKKQGGGGVNIVNGIIEQYKASTSTISANLFVEFINDFNNPTLGTDTTILSTTDSAYVMSAVLVDTNKVFIAHGTASALGNLNGVIVTINNSTITAGTDTQLDSTSNSGKYISAVLIDTNKVFVSYGVGSTNSGYGIVCSISNTTITVGTRLSLALSVYSSLRALKLDTNKVYINAGASNYLYGVICSVNGTTITKDSQTQILSSSGSYGDATLIDTNKIFVAHIVSSALKALVCTISGTTITIGTSTQINSSTDNGISATSIDTNKVFVIFGNNTTNKRLSGKICTISGTTITPYTNTYLSSNNNTSHYSYGKNQIITTSKDKVFIAHPHSSTQLSVLGCKVNNTTITVGTDKDISDNYGSVYYSQPLLLDNEHIMVLHPDDNATNMYINGIIANSTKLIQESVSSIDGITKEEVTTSTAGDVWVLNQE